MARDSQQLGQTYKVGLLVVTGLAHALGVCDVVGPSKRTRKNMIVRKHDLIPCILYFIRLIDVADANWNQPIKVDAERHHQIVDSPLDVPVASFEPAAHAPYLPILEHLQPRLGALAGALNPVVTDFALLARLVEIRKSMLKRHRPKPNPSFSLGLIRLCHVHVAEADG